MNLVNVQRAPAVLVTPSEALTAGSVEAHPMADEAVASIVVSYKFRLLPNRRQHAALAAILESQRLLYNAALEERIGAYRKTGKGRSYIDQCKALTVWRASDADARATPLNIQRWTMKKVDGAYTGFFGRMKRGAKAGFPRFRGKGRWASFGFSEMDGLRFDGRRLQFRALPGGLRVHLHRPIPAGKPLGCTFTRDGKGWSVSFQMRVPRAAPRETGRAIGIDVGLTALATLSDGSVIPNPRHIRAAERETRRRARALARCRRGSNRRKKVKARLAAQQRKVSNARATYLHQVSARLVRDHDMIVVEKLNVKGLAASKLAKSVNDASWGKLRDMLRYKAEWAGAELIEVDPRHTSQSCSGCGVVVPKTLAQRVHSCPDCGLVLDRDHNAALNILHRAVGGPGSRNVGRWPERATGNLMTVSS